MNKQTPANVIIGQDLYGVINSIPFHHDRYHFQKVRDMTLQGRNLSYPLYLITRENAEKND